MRSFQRIIRSEDFDTGNEAVKNDLDQVLCKYIHNRVLKVVPQPFSFFAQDKKPTCKSVEDKRRFTFCVFVISVQAEQSVPEPVAWFASNS
jgi:hypothetical protein